MEILIYKHPFNKLVGQDNPQENSDETICICLIDGLDGEYETYELIKTGGDNPMKIGIAYGLVNAEIFANGYLTN